MKLNLLRELGTGATVTELTGTVKAVFPIQHPKETDKYQETKQNIIIADDTDEVTLSLKNHPEMSKDFLQGQVVIAKAGQGSEGRTFPMKIWIGGSKNKVYVSLTKTCTLTVTGRGQSGGDELGGNEEPPATRSSYAPVAPAPVDSDKIIEETVVRYTKILGLLLEETQMLCEQHEGYYTMDMQALHSSASTIFINTSNKL